ncbi:hypothetical protein ALC53_11035 [Atta colombica]|uniref:Uncharacterized protein n=1 Tax=Atta colombica TaxID=520822 RepID=A0A195B268_9HYME|nr:hypothetical protein ALC53_11035 [Atta colombica]
MNKKKEVVCRVVRYCTVSMAIASLRIRSDFRSVSGKRCVGNGVRKTSRHGNRMLDFFPNFVAARTHGKTRNGKCVSWIVNERLFDTYRIRLAFSVMCTMPFASFACQMCP